LDDDVVVASVMTIGRGSSTRISKFPKDHFGMIVIDECHHSTSSTYQNIIQYFWVKKWDPKWTILLGVTATPNRSDGDGLEELFDNIVCNYDIKYGITNGYLSPIKAYTVRTWEDISEVKVTNGDFSVGELGDAVNSIPRNQIIVETYQKLLNWEKAICFCVDVDHALEVARTFVDYGVKAEVVVGSTNKTDRARIMEDFKNWDLEVLVNVGVATEWFDAPNTKWVLLARPTKSETLYIQQAWRWLRLAENKDHVKLIDFVDNITNNSIISSSCFLGMKKPVMMNGHNPFEFEEQIKQLSTYDPFFDMMDLDIDNLGAKISEVQISWLLDINDEIKAISKNAWQKYSMGYKISLGSSTEEIFIGDKFIETEIRHEIIIAENAIWKYNIELYKLIKEDRNYRNSFTWWKRKLVKIIGVDTKIKWVIQGDKLIEEEFKWIWGLVNQNARWRGEEPTEKQLRILKKFGYDGDTNISKGQACNLLSYYFENKEKNKKLAKNKKKI